MSDYAAPIRRSHVPHHMSRRRPTSHAANVRIGDAESLQALPHAQSTGGTGLWYRRTTHPKSRRRVASESPAMNRPVTAPTPVDYPCSDGQPMAESDFQLEPLVYAITALRTHFHHRKKVYVAEEGLRRRGHVPLPRGRQSPGRGRAGRIRRGRGAGAQAHLRTNLAMTH